MNRLFLFLGILVASCGGAGYSSSSPTGPSNKSPQNGGSTSNSISVGNNFFDPSATTLAIGTAVTWTWNSCSNDGYGNQTCVSHSVVFDDGTKSVTQSSGTYQRTFATAGTYAYHCGVHGAAMSGTVTVK